MSDNPLKLENQLCFRLYSGSRLIIRLYKPLLDKLKLTYPQYVTMLVLWESKTIDFRALGKILNMSTGTLTPIIQRLEKLDYVYKTKNPSDDRKAIVHLSEAGQLLKASALQIPENLANELDMSLEEYFEYTTMLDKLTLKLDRALNSK